MRRLIDFAHRKPLLFLLLLSLGLRFLAVAAMDFKGSVLTVNFASAAAGEQAQMARGLLATGDFTYFKPDGRPAPSAYQPPLYPTMLAGIFSVAGDGQAAYVVVQIIQCLLGALATLLAYGLALRFLVPRYALLAGSLVAIWPAYVYMPNEAHPISFLVPDLLWIALATVDALRSRGSLRSFAWLGLACAAGLMLRSELLAGVALSLLIVIVQLRRPALAGAVAVLAICAAVQVPWMLRNKSSLGKAVLTTTSGVNLFRGNGPTATGGSYQWDGQIVWETPETLAAEKRLHWSKDYEIRLDSVYMAALEASLEHDRLRPLRLLPLKALFFWTSDFTHPKGKLPAAWVPWFLALPAVVYGMIRGWARRRETWPLYVWPALYFLVVLALFALPRYRMNVEAFFLIFAAIGIAAWRERKSGADYWSRGLGTSPPCNHQE